jgi:hypothetical protein
VTGPTGPTGAQGIQGPTGPTGAQGPTGSGGTIANWGSFWSTQDQTAAAINTEYAITFNNSDSNNTNVTLSNNSRINFTYAGVYSLIWSIQFANADNQIQDANVWFKKNGTNIDDSDTSFSIVERHGSIDGKAVGTVNLVLQLAAGDYIELFWQTTDTDVRLEYAAAASPAPAIPSVIFTATQVTYTQVGPTGAAGPTGPTGPTGLGWDVYQTTGYINYSGMTGYNMAAGSLAMNATAPTGAGLNVAIGAEAMQDLTTGDANYALGIQALRDVTTGSRNVALGFRALGGSQFFGNGLTTGNRNMAIGHYSLGLNNGDKNTAIGENCGFYMTTGTKNTFIGSYSGYNNNGDNNIAIGERAMFGGYFYTSTVTGDHNVAIGQYTLQDLTTGNQNIAIGQNALKSITTTSGDIAIGVNTLQANVTGSANVGIGNEVLYNNTANGNTGIGTQALYSATTGGGNTAIGREAGRDVTTGGGNTFIGNFAGNSGTNDITTGSNNTLIGANAAASSATVNNEVTIGDGNVATFRVPGVNFYINDGSNMNVDNYVNVTKYVATTAPATKTADFTLSDTENWIINNKSGSTCVVTLPSGTPQIGRSVTFQNYQNQALDSASSNVVPAAGGSAGTSILSANSGSWATLVYDGTNWIKMQYN